MSGVVVEGKKTGTHPAQAVLVVTQALGVRSSRWQQPGYQWLPSAHMSGPVITVKTRSPSIPFQEKGQMEVQKNWALLGLASVGNCDN